MMEPARSTDPPARQGFEDLYAATYARMLTLATATTLNQQLAEDMVQDAYVQLWRRWNEVTYPITWLRKAVVSNCLAALRTRRRQDDIVRLRVVPTLAEGVEMAHDDFLDLLDGLSERQRMVIVLRFVEDLSEQEIAEVIGCRPGTVKSLSNRALRVLRDKMKEETS